MICENCGEEIEEGLDECPHCHEPLEPEQWAAFEGCTEGFGVGLWG